MISRKFIERVHIAFDELNYHEDSELDYGKFMESAIYALAHCKELSDAKLAVKMINFCNRKWRKIEKLFSSKSDVFKSYEWEGNSIIEIMPDEDAGGVFYITNGIYRKIKIPDAFGPLWTMLIQNSINPPKNCPFDPNEEIGGAILDYLA